jgi:hypothetical protein
VAAIYLDEPAAERSGFHLRLRAGGRGESQLELFAALDDGRREPLGRILVGCGRPAPDAPGGVVVPLAGAVGGPRPGHAHAS